MSRIAHAKSYLGPYSNPLKSGRSLTVDSGQEGRHFCDESRLSIFEKKWKKILSLVQKK